MGSELDHWALNMGEELSKYSASACEIIGSCDGPILAEKYEISIGGGSAFVVTAVYPCELLSTAG